jgi:hypothetical protein
VLGPGFETELGASTPIDSCFKDVRAVFDVANDRLAFRETADLDTIDQDPVLADLVPPPFAALHSENDHARSLQPTPGFSVGGPSSRLPPSAASRYWATSTRVSPI